MSVEGAKNLGEQVMNNSCEMDQSQIKFDEPMARHTFWRTGGSARLFFAPDTKVRLIEFVKNYPVTEQLLWVGLGSNLLIRDGGFPGAIIATYKALNDIALIDETKVYSGAGTPSAIVARYCVEKGLGGVEFLAGIPGTFGGALKMNAGAHGSEIWERVLYVETMDRSGNLHQREPRDFDVGYRFVKGPENEWYLGAALDLTPKPVIEGKNLIRKYLDVRERSQPTRLPNSGSVFKNPKEDFAGRLIEECELKGACIGGACVSKKHANFIVNTGSATATDIESLIDLIRAKVKERFQISLELEVQIEGEKT